MQAHVSQLCPQVLVSWHGVVAVDFRGIRSNFSCSKVSDQVTKVCSVDLVTGLCMLQTASLCSTACRKCPARALKELSCQSSCQHGNHFWQPSNLYGDRTLMTGRESAP